MRLPKVFCFFSKRYMHEVGFDPSPEREVHCCLAREEKVSLLGIVFLPVHFFRIEMDGNGRCFHVTLTSSSPLLEMSCFPR